MSNQILRLSEGGFLRPGAMHQMFYDEYGAYLGQEQENVMGEGPSVFFYRAKGNEAGHFGLSVEDMEGAKDVKGRLPAEALNPAFASVGGA